MRLESDWEEMYTLIQVFGSGWSKDRTRPDRSGQIRCQAAVTAANAALALGRRVCILLMPGNEVWDRSGENQTMAEVYAEYLREYLPRGVAIEVNHSPNVWETIAELRLGLLHAVLWVSAQQIVHCGGRAGIADMSDVDYVLVSDKRHLRRIELTNNRVINPRKEPLKRVRYIEKTPFVGRPNYVTVAAAHESPTWKHEGVSYGIVVCHIFGWGERIDREVDAWHLQQWMKVQQIVLA